MAITLDGTTGITTPGANSTGNITSANSIHTNIYSQTANTAPVIRDSNGTEIGQFAKAWVYFNAVTGTPVITGSFNVTSITDNGVGNFTVNFTTPMQDANYCAMHTAESGQSVSPRATESSTQTTGNVNILTYTFQNGVALGAVQDMQYNKLIVFR